MSIAVSIHIFSLSALKQQAFKLAHEFYIHLFYFIYLFLFYFIFNAHPI